ncbi:MAG: hypothetical protein IT210_03730 [Armatimonadetes bacterium]|nr:hypothetical protein [Armatimonadota bacterium]
MADKSGCSWRIPWAGVFLLAGIGFLAKSAVSVCAESLPALPKEPRTIGSEPTLLYRDSVFTIRAVDRPYEAHRPRPVTTLTIQHRDFPGNRFSLWLPETVYEGQRLAWYNWNSEGDITQKWSLNADGAMAWRIALERFELTATLTPDPQNNCLWITRAFHNTSSETLRGLDTQTCFHLVDAPQFISIFGERIWAKLDGRWRTTDLEDRQESPDPRRAIFVRHGSRPERAIIKYTDFPSAQLREEADHPLIIVEGFSRAGSVGIGQRNFKHLFNNNDPILRCIHSESRTIAELAPGGRAVQEGVILWDRGDRRSLLKRWERITKSCWGIDPARQ